MSTCKSCGARVTWARTFATGAPIPLDPVPQPGGNLELKDGIARVVKPHPAVKLYVSHFKTCPQADAHRKGRRP